MRASQLIVSVATALGLALSGAAVAQDGPTLYKTKTCIACHGPDGAKPIMPTYPKIAGQNKDYAIAQMKDIKSGARANGQSAAMKGVMHLVNDEEIAVIGEWLSTLK
jgi:cytochrome c